MRSVRITETVIIVTPCLISSRRLNLNVDEDISQNIFREQFRAKVNTVRCEVYKQVGSRWRESMSTAPVL